MTGFARTIVVGKMLNFFDRMDCGLVTVSRDKMYGRTSLDFLLYLTTGNGQTYREAFSALTNVLGYVHITSLIEPNDAFLAERALRKAMEVF